MCAQEKVPKEKGTRHTHRLPPMPCVPRQSGGAHNSGFNGAGKPAPLNLPRTGCAPVPGLTAVLGECDGTGGGTPLALPSIAGNPRQRASRRALAREGETRTKRKDKAFNRGEGAAPTGCREVRGAKRIRELPLQNLILLLGMLNQGVGRVIVNGLEVFGLHGISGDAFIFVEP